MLLDLLDLSTWLPGVLYVLDLCAMYKPRTVFFVGGGLFFVWFGFHREQS